MINSNTRTWLGSHNQQLGVWYQLIRKLFQFRYICTASGSLFLTHIRKWQLSNEIRSVVCIICVIPCADDIDQGTSYQPVEFSVTCPARSSMNDTIPSTDGWSINIKSKTLHLLIIFHPVSHANEHADSICYKQSNSSIAQDAAAELNILASVQQTFFASDINQISKCQFMA